MKSIGEAMFPVVAVAALAGAVVWHYATLAPLAHVAVGIDHSLSVQPNCAGLRGATQDLLATKAGLRDGSTLSLMVMGSEARAPEPKLLPPLPLPFSRGGLLRKDKETVRAKQEEIFGQVEEACTETEPGRHSPIYRLVKQGIAHLRSLGCEAGGNCYLLVKSDLVEDVDPVLGAVITRAAKDPAVELPSELAGSIDNAGVQTTFVGLAETRPVRNAKQPPAPETLQRLWRAIFTDPELVLFSPYCGGGNGAQ